VTVDDYDITAMNARTLQAYRRKIGVAFQDYKLLPRKTVAENISFVLEVCGYQKSDIQSRVIEALETVNLLHRMHQFPSELSGGEKQKTSIARAIVHDPRLLIADEPTGNLDPESTREIIEILLKIHAQDRTILLASHNKDMVNFINQRVVALRNGKITSDEQGGLYDLEAIHGDMSDKYLEIHIDSEL
jgi:cell division transport system ATP-binding protein